MGGFDVKRFSTHCLSQSLLNHLKCGICGGIFNNPLDTICEHTFCSKCINEWLKSNNSCPKCRHSLTTNTRTRSANNVPQLKSNRLVKNIINEMKYKCFTDTNGCQQLIAIGSLWAHLENCDRYLCSKCGLKMGIPSAHDCLVLMKAEMNSVREELYEIQGLANDWKRKFKEKCIKLKEMKKKLKKGYDDWVWDEDISENSDVDTEESNRESEDIDHYSTQYSDFEEE